MSNGEQVVELVVTHPLVNILRGAMSILVYTVSHTYTASGSIAQPDHFGFRALKPAIAIYPQFLEMLVTRLSSADHALCANALQLINSLMREAITNDTETEWSKLIKRLQSFGVIEAAYGLMQSNSLQDLSQPLLDFQNLTKVLLRKWRDLPVDFDNKDHRRALKGIHASSNPGRPATPVELGDEDTNLKHNPDKWKRLGFYESPAWNFEDVDCHRGVGYLGMMDLTDYVRKHEDAFRKQLLEQSTKPVERRCPIGRTSIAITAILLEHFEVDKADVEDSKYQLALESKQNFDKIFTPLLLQWSIIHTAGLQAFFRLWQVTNAEEDDFGKIYDLVRILLEVVVGGASRTKEIKEVQRELAEYELKKLREIQMELLELTYEDAWGHHLRQIKDELSHEALQFVKEQRIRCLLAGAWFLTVSKPDETTNGQASRSNSFRYAKLSHNRRYLHYADFEFREETDPSLEMLSEKVDLSTVTSVTSNVSAEPGLSAKTSTETLKGARQSPTTSTKITISGQIPSSQLDGSSYSQGHNRQHSRNEPGTSKSHFRKHSQHQREVTLLVLNPQTRTLASEWLDGLLMLLNQQPITNDTTKLINMIRDYGLKIRLLNVRFDEMGVSLPSEGPEMPSREGVDDDFYYDVFGS